MRKLKIKAGITTDYFDGDKEVLKPWFEIEVKSPGPIGFFIVSGEGRTFKEAMKNFEADLLRALEEEQRDSW